MSSRDKNVDNPPERGHGESSELHIAVSVSEVSSIAENTNIKKTQQRVSTSTERQIKLEKAQRCLENAVMVSKKVKEHRKAAAELLGRPFEEDDGGDTASEMASTMSERTGYSAATDTSTTLSVQEALNIPGISESLANTLKQKEILMERIKQYKEISKRPIIKSSPISRREPKADPKDFIVKAVENTDIMQLYNKIKEKENALTVMQVKMKAMETTIMDLQEKIGEKDQIIEAKTKATSLMSDSLSKKEKDSLSLLEDTRQQMTKMQENFIAMEKEWKEEKQRLLKDIEAKEEKISNLEEANTILENSRFEISVAHSKMAEELDLRKKQILELEKQIQKLAEMKTIAPLPQKPVEKEEEQEKGTIEIENMVELTKRIELLEQMNCQIRQTNKELENKLASIEPKSSAGGSPSKKAASPVPTRKGGRITAAKSKSPWSNLSSESLPQETDKKQAKNQIAKLEMLVQSLNKDILEKEYALSQKDALLSELTTVISEKEAKIVELSNIKLETLSKRETVEVGVVTENPEIPKEISSEKKPEASESFEISVTDLEEKLIAANDQIKTLVEEIETANKNMIKVKSDHKLKIKKMQKTIDNFSKVSDSNAEIIKLNEELHQLSQKVAELEEEKGNLQLHLVDYDSGRLTESDAYKKMVEMETLAESRLKAISILETQKFDLVQELHDLQQKNVEMEDKLADMVQLQNEQVCSEMKSVQLEEQIDNLIASKKELELVVENVKLDKEQLNETIKQLQEEKEEMSQKLEHYIQENIDLTDKLEKLSAEKVSSAESIEIVESLTTQEKLELEEYNKGIVDNKGDNHHREQYTEPAGHGHEIEKLVQESAELNSKIELFTQERQEVMERLNKITSENESLHEKILHYNEHSTTLERNIEVLNNEKQLLQTLNEDLTRQIEELKRERIEVSKDNVDTSKPLIVEEIMDSVPQDSLQDDKMTGERGSKGAKTVKQLTKEILKLKNTIKEREAEIGDCQMKILALEEQQQKQNDSLQTNNVFEAKLKALLEENDNLKQELSNLKQNKDFDNQIIQVREANDLLRKELQATQQEYTSTINVRDARIQELENLLYEYEKQLQNYANTLQQKDKELIEHINQITKLNEVSHKLKSTIEILEEEKAKDQNAELVKSLNKQINVYQKKLGEYEERLRILEEEKAQLLDLKGALENKNKILQEELRDLQDSLSEKQDQIKGLQAQQDKHVNDIAAIVKESKERDEEIHEIKLQLRKESIENEKLRTNLDEKEKVIQSYSQEINEIKDIKDKLNTITREKDEIKSQYSTLETKNKEMLDKLKKFAGNLKKKNMMYTELENQLIDVQKQLEVKNNELEQLSIQLQGLPALQEKLNYAEEELNRILSQKVQQEQQNSQDIIELQNNNKILQEKLLATENDIAKFNESFNMMSHELQSTRELNSNMHSQIESLNKKLVEHEIDQKNNINFVTKISSLENDIYQKQQQINELMNKIENQSHSFNQIQHGHEAKLQERDLYIESLEDELSKYKSRICRLEESISVMEDRRHSLERKADQLGSQLQEKQKAYNEFTSQEDELVNRLAFLMDHDRVVEKQLHEIESDNKELQYKIQNINEENQKLKNYLSEAQDQCRLLKEKATLADAAESDAAASQSKIRELEKELMKIRKEFEAMNNENKEYILTVESEFNAHNEATLKEKKAATEKYEKLSDYVKELEQRLQEYSSNIQNLRFNLEEATKLNQELTENSNVNKIETPDYTEQYISEINRLNAIVNSKHNDIEELTKKTKALQASYETRITELSEKYQQSINKIDKLIEDNNFLKKSNSQLQANFVEKEEHYKQLIDKKRVSFEINIPKTEGMIISSTIEALNVDPSSQRIHLESAGPQMDSSFTSNLRVDIASLESQMLSDVQPIPQQPKGKTAESYQKTVKLDGIEPEIVPKKAYLCYKGEEDAKDKTFVEEMDPFNSDEGWGLGETEAEANFVPAVTQLNEQINQLTKENEGLKADLAASNLKLLKALKRLKELKSSNEMLTNELKLSKQMTDSSFLDSAIEDELKGKIQELEKKIEELNADFNKEKREKEVLKKQNEVFQNANDKFTELKEKMDNELELWKFKFKEANDKVGSLQWEGESKTPDHNYCLTHDSNNTRLTDEILKLEKENDELSITIEQINTENNELISQQAQLKSDIISLNNQLQHQLSSLNLLNDQLSELKKENSKLLNRENNYYCDSQNKKISELEEEISKLRSSKELLAEKIQQSESRIADLEEKNLQYEAEISELHRKKELVEEELQQKNSLVEDMKRAAGESEEYQQKINTICSNLEEKCNNLELESSSLKLQLENANTKISSLLNEISKHKDRIIFLEQQAPANLSQPSDIFIAAEKNATIEDQMQEMKSKLDNANSKMIQLENDKIQVDQKIKEYEDQISELNDKMQKVNAENDQLLSTVTELRSSVSNAIDQRGFEIAELWKQHLAQREAEFQRMEQELRTQLSSAENKYEQLLDNVQSSNQEETSKLIMVEQINALQTKLQDKEEHLLSLQSKYAEVMSQIDVLRSEIDDEKVMFENKLLGQREEYEKQIKDLTYGHKESTDNYSMEVNELLSAANMAKKINSQLSNQLEESNHLRTELEANVIELTNQLRLKDTEVFQKTSEYSIALAQRNDEFENVRQQLLEYEKKIEDLNYEKEAELAVLRLKMHENTDYYNNILKEHESKKNTLEEQLNAKILECTNLNRQITELNKLLEEQSIKASEMQTALENQELEIVTLKDEIDKLDELLQKTHSSKIEKHVRFTSDTKPASEEGFSSADTSFENDLLDAVPRAELDLALYMLHQRDVRCEELTMELTQLLEERDTLQLRLSDSLRSYEDLKLKCKAAGLEFPAVSQVSATVTEGSTQGADKETHFVDTHRTHAPRSSSVSDPDGDNPKLHAKLSELRSVRQSRDVRLRQDSEQRQLDMRLMQRDVANLPPEAVEQLQQAHHTLSRDSQSTSTVLLNWFRGKSTPKVVHEM